MRTLTNPATNTPTITPEGQPINNFGGPPGEVNPAVKLDTDDPNDAYEKDYPSWSPFRSIFSITYDGDRSVTYNDPNTSVPLEVAASIPDGGAYPGGGTVSLGYVGILQSLVLNLDPPTLLPFNASEEVHVNAANGPTATPVLGTSGAVHFINPSPAGGSSYVTFTVRLSNREAGISDNGVNGLPDVYLQVKDPDSKYQDSQALDHKVFAKDSAYFTALNPLTGTPYHPLTDSGSAEKLINGTGVVGANKAPRNLSGNTPNFFQRGAIGGEDRNGNTGTISVGHDNGGSDTYTVTNSDGTTTQSPSSRRATAPSPASSPRSSAATRTSGRPGARSTSASTSTPASPRRHGDPLTTPATTAPRTTWPVYDDQGVQRLRPDRPDHRAAGEPGFASPASAATPPRPAVQRWLPRPTPARSGSSSSGSRRPSRTTWAASFITPPGASPRGQRLVPGRDRLRQGPLPGSALRHVRVRQPAGGSGRHERRQLHHPDRRPAGQLAHLRQHLGVHHGPVQRQNDILVVSDNTLGQKFACPTFQGQTARPTWCPSSSGPSPTSPTWTKTCCPTPSTTASHIRPRRAEAVTTPAFTAPSVQRLHVYNSGQAGLTSSGGLPYSAILNGLGVGSYYDSTVGQDGGPGGRPVPDPRSQQLRHLAHPVARPAGPGHAAELPARY